MLQGLHRVGKSVVGRVIVTVLFGFLIVSFAVWGIGDIFRGTTRTEVASVGKVDVSADSFRTAYQAEYQALIRRARTSVTPDQARALGLEQRVLGRLVTEAALDQRARGLGLAAPDALIVKSIQADPSFQGTNGGFDRSIFADLLRSNGLSEGQYIRDQRGYAVRIQMAEALSGSLVVPLAMQEAVHRYQTEQRTIDLIEVTPAALASLPEPTDEQLRVFYDGRKTSFAAPEYRAVSLLTLDAAALAKPDAVSDADARAYYGRLADSRFGEPEKRTVQQIAFPTRAEAESAFARVKAGESFEALAVERNVSPDTLTLGTFSRGEMFDPAAAEAAFALEPGAVSGPVEGRFGPVLVRVTTIVPGTAKPFETVLPEIRIAIALDRARAELQTVHDAIEDARASGKSLAEVARERNLPLRGIEAVDRSGNAPDGQAVAGLPDAPNLLAGLFRSEVGADTEAVTLKAGGYVWFEVTKVTPARDRPFDEVRERVAAEWKADALETALGDRTRDMAGRIAGGEEMAKVAADAGLAVRSVAEIGRGASGDLPAGVVARIFATPVGQAADARAGDARRAVFQVKGATVPAFVTTTQAAAATEERLRAALSEDILAAYIAAVEKQVGVSIYPQNIRRAIGGES